MSYYYPPPTKLERDIVGPFNTELWPLNNYGNMHFCATSRHLLAAVAVVNNNQHSSVDKNLTILLVFFSISGTIL
jgi:hypothetical protein